MGPSTSHGSSRREAKRAVANSSRECHSTYSNLGAQQQTPKVRQYALGTTQMEDVPTLQTVPSVAEASIYAPSATRRTASRTMAVDSVV